MRRTSILCLSALTLSSPSFAQDDLRGTISDHYRSHLGELFVHFHRNPELSQLAMGAKTVRGRNHSGSEARLQVLNELMRVAVSSLDMAEIFDEVGERIKKLID